MATPRNDGSTVMNIFQLAKPAILLLSFLATPQLSHATFGPISIRHFQTNGCLIIGEITEINNEIYGKVKTISKITSGNEYQIPAEGDACKLDKKLVEDVFFLETTAPKFESELYQKGVVPSDDEIAAAQVKDQAYKKQLREKLKQEQLKAGLSFDPATEGIVYYYTGRAKVRVTESLKGNLKAGDEIEVTWDKIMLRIPCPPIVPNKTGKMGFFFKDSINNGDTAEGHAFRHFDKALEARDLYEKQQQNGEPK